MKHANQRTALDPRRSRCAFGGLVRGPLGRCALGWILLLTPAYAANFYVANASSTPAGSDSNNGSIGAPWLTLAHALANIACGDTINIVADGRVVAGDATLPGGATLDAAMTPKPWSNCGQTSTIQSSRLSEFQPAGYRTWPHTATAAHPHSDSGLYGKLAFTSGPLGTKPSVYTQNEFYLQSPISVNVATSTFTITNGGNAFTLAGLANGKQMIFTVRSAASNYGTQLFPSIAAPGGFAFFTHYYVVNCSGSCGDVNSTFQLAATSGGSPITVTSCASGSYCAVTRTTDPSGACAVGDIAYNTTNSHTFDCRPATCAGTWCAASYAPFLQIAIVGAQVDVAANTITMAVNWGTGSLANGMPLNFSAVDTQQQGTLPAPLDNALTYYVTNLMGSTFKPSLTPGGTPVTLTTVGLGATMLASADEAHNWAFRGLEFFPSGSATPVALLQLGGVGAETSVSGMPYNMEVDRCYLHDTPPTITSIVHMLEESGKYLYVHDSWIIGAQWSEAQAVFGAGSPGPTAFINTFLEGSTEIILYGGGATGAPQPNTNKLFVGNYWFKPPAIRLTQCLIVNSCANMTAPSGACLYDATTDPTHAGGEWFFNDNLMTTTWRCNASSVWAAAGVSLPTGLSQVALKNMEEHKGGSYFTTIGNVFNGSYAQGQSGEVFNLSQENDSGAYATDDHNTQLYNVAINSVQWQTRTSQCGATTNLDCPSGPCCDISRHNLMIVNPLACGVSFDTAFCGYTTRQSTWSINAAAGVMQGDNWDHNTFWLQDSSPIASPSPMTLTPINGIPPPAIINRAAVTNNLMFGVYLGDSANTTNVIPLYFTNSFFDSNALFLGSAHTPGTGNTWTHFAYPAANATIAYVNATGGYGGAADYHLSSSSPYSAANAGATLLSPDGTDLGADIDMINLATSGAAAGTPPWDQLYGVHWSVIGSTKAVLSYTAPTSAACTATIYSTPVRNLAGGGNIVATVLDSAASSISDGLRREILITGLTASTQYWWKLSCAGGVLIVDPNGFKTRAAGGTLQFPFQMSSATALTYSSNKDLSAGTTLSAAATQYVPVATNATVYSQFSGGQLHVSVAP